MAFIKGLISRKSSGCQKIAFTCMILLSAVSCSSDNKPIKLSSLVEDPVEIKLKGISNSVLQTNAEAYLSTLPPISKIKARLYGRDITEKVTQALHTYGYYHPKIKITYPKKDEKFNRSVLVDVDPGKPLFIRNCEIEITGEGSNYDSFNRIVEKSGVKTYSILDHSRYRKLKEDLLSRAFDMGFFDAKLTESRILVYQEQNAADIQIVLSTGKRYKFGELKSSDSTIELLKPSMPLVNFNPATDYSSKTINDFSQSLSQTGFYKSVDVRPLVEERKDQSVPVYLDLEKQSSNMFRVGAGYSTDERVRGILGWDKPMINDKGHSLSSFIRASTVKIDAQTVYKIPHKNPNLDYFFIKLAQTHTDYNDTLSDLSHVSFHYTAYMTGSWRRDYYLSLEYEDYTQGDEKGHTVNFIPGITISRRSTTGGLLPAAGYSVTFDNRFGTRAITDLNFWHSELTLKGAFAITENTRLLYRYVQGANLGSDSLKVPPSLRFFAGGDQNLRGFSYKSQSDRINGKLTGSRYLTAGSLEFNFPIPFENSRVAVFLDTALCTNNYSNNDLLYGPGLGYRYLSPYGILKIDLAYGIDNKRDNREFKLHLSFGPEF